MQVECRDVGVNNHWEKLLFGKNVNHLALSLIVNTFGRYPILDDDLTDVAALLWPETHEPTVCTSTILLSETKLFDTSDIYLPTDIPPIKMQSTSDLTSDILSPTTVRTGSRQQNII